MISRSHTHARARAGWLAGWLQQARDYTIFLVAHIDHQLPRLPLLVAPWCTAKFADICPKELCFLLVQDLELWLELLRVLQGLEADPAVRGVIWASGLKRDVFTAGNDLKVRCAAPAAPAVPALPDVLASHS